MTTEFRSKFAERQFRNKYAAHPKETWKERAEAIVTDVCGRGTRGQYDSDLLSRSDQEFLVQAIASFKFLPGGRYIYYAGRPINFYNNCFLLKVEEDTREEWAELAKRAVSCLMSGGGIGVDYSILRPSGSLLKRTGGLASGPIPLMHMVNEIGRNVMQGGSRRSAIYASLNWQHEDAQDFLVAKNWGPELVAAKARDFNSPAPLDMTNISLNYDNAFLKQIEKGNIPQTFLLNCHQALETSEPGFSFSFGSREKETLRNACTEVVSEDDSDVCNLGSINIGAIDSYEEFRDIVQVATKFLVCGTLRADVPYPKISEVREKNRRLGLGLMGIHEWLLKRGHRYEVVDELHNWLSAYEGESRATANSFCDKLSISHPVACRAIAPTGTIGILAGTTTGIEPLFATAYKRRYLTGGTNWKYEYVVDSVAELMVDKYGLDPDNIETAQTLAGDFERRIKFQADVQDYVDMGISSTINLPCTIGSGTGPEPSDFARTVARYAPRLRGLTCYADGSRGGQPLTTIKYGTAIRNRDVVHAEHDVCEITGKGGTCGV